MATTVSAIMSFEEFEQLPDGDGFHREIIEGELLILASPKAKHSVIASKCFEALLPLKQQGLGMVFLEAGYKLSDGPATFLEPDASFLKTSRVKEKTADGYFHSAPELAVEIVSPSESASDLQRKVRWYLQTAGLAVWVIYPKTLTVEVHLPDGTSSTKTMTDFLDPSFLQAGWSLPVAKLFEE